MDLGALERKSRSRETALSKADVGGFFAFFCPKSWGWVDTEALTTKCYELPVPIARVIETRSSVRKPTEP